MSDSTGERNSMVVKRVLKFGIGFGQKDRRRLLEK
jgi:hypothetical protein